MARRRAESPFEDDNSLIDGFLEWIDAPEGQRSIEAPDLVFDALEHAVVDARRRKIVWADGQPRSIEQSVVRIHAEHPGMPRDLIETHVLGCLESCAPEFYSERQIEELDRLIEPMARRLPAHVTRRQKISKKSALLSVSEFIQTFRAG